MNEWKHYKDLLNCDDEQLAHLIEIVRKFRANGFPATLDGIVRVIIGDIYENPEMAKREVASFKIRYKNA